MNWAIYVLHACVCLTIALGGAISPKLTLLGVPYAIWLVTRRNFKYMPAIGLLFVNTGFHVYAVLATILFVSVKDVQTVIRHRSMKSMLLFCCVPAGFALIMVIRGYIAIGRLSQVGILADFWSVTCLFCFIYGRLIHRTITERSLLQFVLSGIVLLSCQFLTLTTELSFIRLLFFFGPLSVATAVYGLVSARGSMILLGTAGSAAFAVFMGKTYDTLTLLGLSFIGAILALWYGFIGKVKISKSAVLIIYLSLFLGIAYAIKGADVVFATQDYGRDSSFSTLIVQDRMLFLERLRMKAFGDRGRVWRGAWENITRPPWLLGSVFDREIELQLDNGNYADVGFGAHNLFLHNIVQYRWLAGTVADLLFIWMMVQSSQVLRMQNLPVGLAAIGITVLTTGMLGACAGTFPMLPMFGGIFLVLAGVCAGVARTSVNLMTSDFRHMTGFFQGTTRSS